VAIGVHGLIFGFFFVGGQIYIDKKAPKEIQAQAQGFFFLATFGLGNLIGNFANGKLMEVYTVNDAVNWSSMWTTITIISAVLMVVFLLFFRDDTRQSDNQNSQNDEPTEGTSGQISEAPPA
jgi:MFS family permease